MSRNLSEAAKIASEVSGRAYKPLSACISSPINHPRTGYAIGQLSHPQTAQGATAKPGKIVIGASHAAAQAGLEKSASPSGSFDPSYILALKGLAFDPSYGDRKDTLDVTRGNGLEQGRESEISVI